MVFFIHYAREILFSVYSVCPIFTRSKAALENVPRANHQFGISSRISSKCNKIEKCSRMNHRSFGTGEPYVSPVPSVRPTHSNPELTVPEPSLISEWNSKLIISDESESENENDVKETTQEQKTVKFNLDQSGVPPMQISDSRKRRSEPILNKSAPSQYFQSVENRMPIGSPVTMTHSSMTHPTHHNPHHPTVHQVYQS